MQSRYLPGPAVSACCAPYSRALLASCPGITRRRRSDSPRPAARPARSTTREAWCWQAWLQRRPIVAVASEGPSALIEDGRTGLLTAKEDAAALAAAIARVGESPALARSLAAAGRAAYERSYTEESVVDAYLDLFDRLLRHPPAGRITEAQRHEAEEDERPNRDGRQD